nr:hypothetical protein [Tanacetum cinerariifolium]
MPLKEETFQVVIDKNSSCFKAFTISADVQEIFMQQLWYSIKKVQRTYSYEFILANKKCMVNADVFRMIFDIYPRVEGVNFTNVPDDDTTLAFLIKLGYKGPLYKHINMFVDHMHQPWRTLAAIINKENVDYPELIWEDLAYQIDYRKEKRSRHKNMSFPRFTKEYGLPIPETILTEAIKQSKTYQMFIKYSTGQIPPKKSKGKGSKRKKIIDDSQETVDVSEESEPEHEPVKRKTSSKKRVKKKVTLSANDNIISDDPVTALELGKSISKTKAEEAEAARQVHATHASIVTESVLEPTRRRKSGKVTSDPPKKLKGVPSLTPKEQEAADIMQDLKESKKTSKRQLGTRGSNEGTGTIPGVPNESIIVSATSKEDKLDDEEKDDKERDADDETESDEDDIYKYKIRVRKDEDEEMLNAEVEDFDKGDEEVIDAIKTYAKKTSKVKDDAKKTELPPTSSSLSVSLGFGDKFLKHSSYSSLVSTIKDTTDVEINSLLVVKIQFEFSQIQSPSVLRVPVSQIPELPKKQTPTVDLEQESEKTPSEILKIKKEQAETANHRLYHALMGALIEDENAMDKGVADTIQDHKRKHDDDDEDDDDEDPPSGPNQGKQTKRRRTKDSESLKKPSTTKETPTGKAPSKGSKTGKSTSANEQVEEPIAEVVMDDAGDDVIGLIEMILKEIVTPLIYPNLFLFKVTQYTLIMKTKVAQYEIEGIEDMVPTLWSPTKVGYDKDALKGIKHYGERRNLWHRSQLNKFFKHNVYSTKKILGVNSVSVKKLYGYGHLEEIMVKRADCQFYKFKEGDFMDLHLIDIEDMMLLVVQHKLFHLTKNDIVDFIVALRMFTRSLIIKKRVEDLQLGVESYQKKLNITSP